MNTKLKFYAKAFLPSARKWWKDRHADEAAALAFYSLISLVPLIIVSVYVASIVIDEKTVKDIVIAETDRVAGTSIGEYIASMLHNEVKWTGSGFSPILGFFLIIFSATKMVSKLRLSLAKVFGQLEKKKKVFAGLISRLVSFLLILILGGIIICAVAINMIVNLVMGAVADQPLLLKMTSYITPLSSFIGVIILATLTMRWLPEKKPRFKAALAGGIVCSSLIFILKISITQIIKHTDIGGYYGSAFTLVLVLFWVYFTMQFFLYGAEYAAEVGKEIYPKKEKAEREKAPYKKDSFLT